MNNGTRWGYHGETNGKIIYTYILHLYVYLHAYINGDVMGYKGVEWHILANDMMEYGCVWKWGRADPTAYPCLLAPDMFFSRDKDVSPMDLGVSYFQTNLTTPDDNIYLDISGQC